MKQDTFLEQYYALANIFRRQAAVGSFDDPYHGGDLGPIAKQLGSAHGGSVGENAGREGQRSGKMHGRPRPAEVGSEVQSEADP